MKKNPQHHIFKAQRTILSNSSLLCNKNTRNVKYFICYKTIENKMNNAPSKRRGRERDRGREIWPEIHQFQNNDIKFTALGIISHFTERRISVFQQVYTMCLYDVHLHFQVCMYLKTYRWVPKTYSGSELQLRLQLKTVNVRIVENYLGNPYHTTQPIKVHELKTHLLPYCNTASKVRTASLEMPSFTSSRLVVKKHMFKSPPCSFSIQKFDFKFWNSTKQQKKFKKK